MRQLKVYLYGERAGQLTQDGEGRLRFAYADEWLSRSDAKPLSRSLPLGREAFENRVTRAFFAGILPEETVRQQVAAVLGISVENEFGILERIGGECAGAVSVLTDAFPVTTPASPRELSVAELGEILHELPRRPLLAGQPDVRLSLAGVQGKLPLVFDSGRCFLPQGAVASSHILKPEPDRFPGLVANEYFCLRLAAAAGLPVPKASVGEAGGIPYLLIERYDRTHEGPLQWARLHQEDFCQALGVPPERKYEQEGGPTLRDAVQLLREWSTAPVLDLLTFVDAVAFNVFIGNADAHSKNFSFLYAGSERRLAPLYDLVCTLSWPELSARLSMKVGGCKQIAEVNPGHWRKFAQEVRIAWPGLQQRLHALHERVSASLPSVHHEISSIHPAMAATVRDRIESQLKRLEL